MDQARLQQMVNEAGTYTGRSVLRWYKECGNEGCLVQRALVDSIDEAKERQERYFAALGQPSGSAISVFEPKYTALTAPCQGGKSFAQSFVEGYARVRTSARVVHITLNPSVACQLTHSLRRNMQPLSHPVVNLGPCASDQKLEAADLGSIYVVAATTARLTRLAAELYRHWLWCREQDFPYDVVVDVDEADWLFACKPRKGKKGGGSDDETLFRNALYTILGRRAIKATDHLAPFDGKQLPPPRHVFLTTATESGLVVQFERVSTAWQRVSEIESSPLNLAGVQVFQITVDIVVLPTHPDYIGQPADFELLDNILVSEVKQKADGYHAFADPRLFRLYDHAAAHPLTMVLNVTNTRVTGDDGIYRTDAIFSERYPLMAALIIADDRLRVHGPGIRPDWRRKQGYDEYAEDQLEEALLAAHTLAGSNPVHILLNPAKGLRGLSFLVITGTGANRQIARRLTHSVQKLGAGYSTDQVLQTRGRLGGNGRSWLRSIGMEKLVVMEVRGDFDDAQNYAAYKYEVDMRMDDHTLTEAYCGTSANPLPSNTHLGIGAAEFGPRSRPVRC